MRLPRFQYSLRTVFIVLTLLAIPLGYVGWQAKIVRERKAMLVTIQTAGGDIWSNPPKYISQMPEESMVLPWYRHVLGDYEVWGISLSKSMLDESAAIQAMFPEACVWPPR